MEVTSLEATGDAWKLAGKFSDGCARGTIWRERVVRDWECGSSDVKEKPQIPGAADGRWQRTEPEPPQNLTEETSGASGRRTPGSHSQIPTTLP